jgi:hypothetical protein
MALITFGGHFFLKKMRFFCPHHLKKWKGKRLFSMPLSAGRTNKKPAAP